jgi:hypothetical protein
MVVVFVLLALILWAAVLLWTRSNAWTARFSHEGVPMRDVIFHVGDAPKTFHLDLLKPDETIDETYSDEQFGYDAPDSGVRTAVDGSSSFTVSGLDITVTPLAPSAVVDGAPVPSSIFGAADSDARPEGVQLVAGHLRVTVLPVNVDADHAEFREIV